MALSLSVDFGGSPVSKTEVKKTLMDDLAASDPALAAKLMAGAPNQASHKMRK